MREHPVIFSNPLAAAIRAGRKTQTRRLLTTIDAHGRAKRSGWTRVLVGERLWVKEQWTRKIPALGEGFQYGSDPLYEGFQGDERRDWKPARWMPRNAARTILEVTDLRHQRLHEISDDDCRAEGIGPGAEHEMPWGVRGWPSTWTETPRESFAALWDDIHDRQDWRSNPEIVAITFRLLEPEPA